jgi:hypothetical protein
LSQVSGTSDSSEVLESSNILNASESNDTKSA